MSPVDDVHPAGVLVQPGRPFGALPLPAGVVPVTVRVMAGELTALYAPPPDPDSSRTRGTVLLVPGVAGSKEDFLPVLAGLAADGWTAWALSQRGQGDSVAPLGVVSYRMDDLVTDLLQVADVVGDGEPVHVVGHGFGGMVGRAAAVRSPGTVASLAFVASGPKCWTEAVRDVAHTVRMRGTLGWWESQHQADLSQLIMSPELEFERFRAGQTSSDGLVGILTALLDEPDRTAELLATGVRTLVMHGTEDDGWPQHWQELMARALGSEYVVVEGAGHLPPLDAPDVTARLLSDFFGHAEGAAGGA